MPFSASAELVASDRREIVIQAKVSHLYFAKMSLIIFSATAFCDIPCPPSHFHKLGRLSCDAIPTGVPRIAAADGQFSWHVGANRA